MSKAPPAAKPTPHRTYFLLTELVGKRLALMHELVPGAKRIAVLVNPTNAAEAGPTVRDASAAGRELGLDVQVFNAGSRGEIEAAFTAIVSWRADALFVGPDPSFSAQGTQLVSLAQRHMLPGSYFSRDLVEAGGLMSYGSDLADNHRQLGVYAGRILKGEKASDLPV